MVLIREYKKEDKGKILKLVRATLFDIFGKMPEVTNLNDLNDIRKSYFSRGGVFYVAEHNGKIIGTIGVRKYKGKNIDNKGKIAELKRLYVDKNYRKRRIGKKLLDKVLIFCKLEGYKKIILSTSVRMEDAIKFYKRNGFKNIEEIKVRCKGVLFEKNL